MSNSTPSSKIPADAASPGPAESGASSRSQAPAAHLIHPERGSTWPLPTSSGNSGAVAGGGNGDRGGPAALTLPSLSRATSSVTRDMTKSSVVSGGSPLITPRGHQHRQPFVIGVAGGTASGKTTVCDCIMQRLHDQCVVMLSQDSFYRGLTPEEIANAATYNFDHPDAFDRPLLITCLQELSAGRPFDVPVYDFTTHSRSSLTRRVDPSDVIILEGILVLAMEEVRGLLNMKIFVDTDDDVRLARRIQRDISHRGRDVGGVIEQYTRFVKPCFDQFVAPSRRYADIIIPWHSEVNLVAIDLITEHIRTKLRQHELVRHFPNLEVIPSNYQIRGMHTILRNAATSKSDFVFYANRLNRLVVEAGLGHLPFREVVVNTPTGHPYVGVEFARGICGVSVVRSGEAMESALRECCQGIKIGKILIQRRGPVVAAAAAGRGNDAPNCTAAPPAVDGSGGQATAATASTSQQQAQPLIYEKLPSDIAGRYVLLMDPVLGTGISACAAVQVLVSKGVRPEKVLFLCLMASPEGVRTLFRTFPDIKVITSEIDSHVDSDTMALIPGVGEFGDRYYSD